MQKMTPYKKFMLTVASFLPQKVRPIFLHPAGVYQISQPPTGPTTVFFWAPMFKWGLVLANIGDLKRPADSISINQTGVLAATASIWCRYSMVIIPKNWNLFLVNFFVAISSLYQISRAVQPTQTSEK